MRTNRRTFLISALALLLGSMSSLPAWAKDGRDDDDGDSSGHGSGHDDEDNSGHGNSHDGDDEDHSGHGGGGDDDDWVPDSQVRDAVSENGLISLDEMLAIFARYGTYSVVDVSLRQKGQLSYYRLKFIDEAGNVRRADFDAATGQPVP
jgi:uncharacterized membrane protein YkoI